MIPALLIRMWSGRPALKKSRANESTEAGSNQVELLQLHAGEIPERGSGFLRRARTNDYVSSGFGEGAGGFEADPE